MASRVEEETYHNVHPQPSRALRSRAVSSREKEKEENCLIEWGALVQVGEEQRQLVVPNGRGEVGAQQRCHRCCPPMLISPLRDGARRRRPAPRDLTVNARREVSATGCLSRWQRKSVVPTGAPADAAASAATPRESQENPACRRPTRVSDDGHVMFTAGANVASYRGWPGAPRCRYVVSSMTMFALIFSLYACFSVHPDRC